MRKKVLKLLLGFLSFFLLLILPINFAIRLSLSQQELKAYSRSVFWQIEQLMEKSEEEIRQAKEEFTQECLNDARLVAHLLEIGQETLEDTQETRELAAFLRVDEIHLIDPNGVIYGGTHPEYYQYSFHSGGQIGYFLPMLEDHNLELCQEITPNTAEGKMMQYAAVWRKDGTGIVQIGMEPSRVMEIVADKTPAAILSLLPNSVRGTIYVVEPKTCRILAATDKKYVGADLHGILDLSRLQDGEPRMEMVEKDGVRYTVILEKRGDWIYANTYPLSYFLRSILVDTIFLLIYLILLSLTTIILVTSYMNKRLVKGLEGIVSQLGSIEEGNLERIQIHTEVPEFDVLQHYLNKMLKNMRGSFHKFNTVIERSHIPIGIYEYNTFYHQAFANRNILEILKLDSTQEEPSQECLDQVAQRIEEIKEHPLKREEHIYQMTQGDAVIWVQMEELTYEQSRLVWMMDVSQWWGQMETLKTQRDVDELTQLYNRRGFCERVETLLAQEEAKWGSFVVIDADGLKQVNDDHGHHQGDRYLKEITKILKELDQEHAVCARVGGDEFTLFLHGYQSKEEVEETIRELQQKRDVRKMQIDDKTEVSVRFSLGYALYPEEGQEYQVLIRRADERMYQEKRERKKA